MRRTLVALVITVILLGVLLSQVDLHSIVESFKRISPTAVCAGLLAWVFMNWLRAVRFRALVRTREIRPGRMLSIVNVQNLLATVTPARAGELSYVVLLRQEGRVPGAEGLGGLVLARAFDFVISCGMALFGLLAVREALPAGSWAIVGITTAAFAGSLVLLLQIAWISEKGLGALGDACRWLGLERWTWVRRLVGKLGELHEYIVQAQTKDLRLRLWLLSAGIWTSSYVISWFWIVGLDLPLSAGQILFVAAIAGLAGALPIQGLAGLGTTEAGWAIPLILVGVAKEDAIAASFCFHALAILYVSVLGGLGALHLGLARRAVAVSHTNR